MQRFIISGILGSDPELKYAASGIEYTNLSVAHTENYKGKKTTSWYRIAVFGATAVNCANYTAKGKKVLVEGRISSEVKEIEGRRYTFHSFVATNVEFLEFKPRDNNTYTGAPAATKQQQVSMDDQFTTDDIPF